MKDLSCELKKLDSYSGVEYAQRINELIKEFPNHRGQIDKYVEKRVLEVAASADEVINKGVRYQLGEIVEVLSLSYIAKIYFKKSRQWMTQRINGCVVNGKPAKFTDDQLKTFNRALHDIGSKIGSVNLI